MLEDNSDRRLRRSARVVYEFLSADWTPWQAILRLRQRLADARACRRSPLRRDRRGGRCLTTGQGATRRRLPPPDRRRAVGRLGRSAARARRRRCCISTGSTARSICCSNWRSGSGSTSGASRWWHWSTSSSPRCARLAPHVLIERRADWLVMATRLVLLRSRLLFPATPEAAAEAEREAEREVARIGSVARHAGGRVLAAGPPAARP